jgi:hypothetical protein
VYTHDFLAFPDTAYQSKQRRKREIETERGRQRAQGGCVRERERERERERGGGGGRVFGPYRLQVVPAFAHAPLTGLSCM